MPRLLLLNGPPGIGTTTLARRYVHDRPLALCLDLDPIRRNIGRWEEHEEQSGLLTRAMVAEMARMHLAGGHDVAVPQFLARVEFIEQLEAVATDAGATFCEVVLMDDKDAAQARFAARADDPELATHHAEAQRMVGGQAGLAAMYDLLQTVLAHRPHAIVVDTRAGEKEAAYQALLAALGDA